MVRHPGWLVVAAALSGACPAAAQNPFNFLQQLVPAVQQPAGQQEASPVSRMQGGQPAGQTGAAGGLGTDAVAVVEAIDEAPDAGVQFMDYVFSGQTLSLGAKGKLTLSYLSGCLVETITGGTVMVAPAGSRVTGGRLQAKPAGNCQTAAPIVTASATEAGATVNRVTPFDGQNWSERTIKGARPMFKWDDRGRPVTIRVLNLDSNPAQIVWQVASSAGFADYPANAPPLAVGMPYRVEIIAGGQVLRAANFSIDPGLEVPDTLANRVVPVTGS